jgi:hypothetical protein
VLYTTNMVESLNYQLRKITRNRGHFPTDDALFKLLYLGVRNVLAKQRQPGDRGPGTPRLESRPQPVRGLLPRTPRHHLNTTTIMTTPRTYTETLTPPHAGAKSD